MQGIEAGVENGFQIKLNTVALKGINDDELIDLINFAKIKKCSNKIYRIYGKYTEAAR